MQRQGTVGCEYFVHDTPLPDTVWVEFSPFGGMLMLLQNGYHFLSIFNSIQSLDFGIAELRHRCVIVLSIALPQKASNGAKKAFAFSCGDKKRKGRCGKVAERIICAGNAAQGGINFANTVF